MNIIVTGASKGIGYEIVKSFVKSGNHTIIVVSRNLNNLEKLKNECYNLNSESQIIPIPFDLKEMIQNEGIFLQKIEKLADHIDILINNAGYLVNQPFNKINMDEAIEIFNVNFYAPAFLIKELLPLMGSIKITHVVNIGSIGGLQGSSKYSGLAFYSASKAALAVLTECLSKEYEKSKLYFNCLALGSVNTEMLKKAFPGFKATLNASEMAEFITEFALNGYKYFRGKILPVSISNP